MAHKIIMLGGRRSGKSTILASILHALEQKSEYFTVIDKTDYANDESVPLSSKQIEIDNYLKEHNKAIGNQHFLVNMTPTKGKQTYHLRTMIHGDAKVDFDFVDVKGESMEATSGSHHETEELVSQSDVFIVAIDTPYLMQEINSNINTEWNRIKEITDMLCEIKISDEEIDKKLILLCPVKCERWTQNGQAEQVTDKVCMAYRRLINNWGNSKAVDIWVMPIETAGGIIHSKLLKAYRMFEDKNDRQGQQCSKNDITGQIMLKDGEIMIPTADTILEPDGDMRINNKTLFTDIPFSWYVVNGKGFSPRLCEQPAFHLLRFLVKKEQRIAMIEKEKNDALPWFIRVFINLWTPPFGKYLKAYTKLINQLEDNHLIKTNGDGFRKAEAAQVSSSHDGEEPT